MIDKKLKPQQIKTFKQREEEVLKADEDGFIDIRNIEWFADEIFAAGDKAWGLEILRKIEDFAENFYDLEGVMDRLDKLNEKDRLLTLIKKAEPLIEKEDYGVSGCYLSSANYMVSIDEKYARELYAKSKEMAVDFNEFNFLGDAIADDNYLGDKKNGLKIHLQSIALIDHKDHHNQLSQSAQVVKSLIGLGEISEESEKVNFNDSIKILTDYRKKNNL